MKLNINSARCDSKLSKDQCVAARAPQEAFAANGPRPRHESPDCGGEEDYACAVTPIQPMQPRGELLN
ncbi:hypothetical protein EVAR_104038_1 [Eumeta japonica]|uniref:Uncharacterized protein n=1 Tax=Eumeta variegata TaxID=151549 RepID=A0A4C1SIS1_EUMVA|nr:hypothetical protein EVAR_104038_1 [Eumeta japonica]